MYAWYFTDSSGVNRNHVESYANAVGGRVVQLLIDDAHVYLKTGFMLNVIEVQATRAVVVADVNVPRWCLRDLRSSSRP
jgi:hypothetical protein